jgi:hypothetical protein
MNDSTPQRDSDSQPVEFESETEQRHPDGSRLVRTDWLRAYVRSIEPAVTPMQLAALAQRPGWIKRGKEGRWLARQPSGTASINWSFWLVKPDWEHRGDPAKPACYG